MEIDVTSPTVAPAIVVTQPGPITTVVTETKVTSIDVKGFVSAKADAHFVFEQNLPSNTWVVNHNLGKKPAAVVVDTTEHVVIGDIQYNSLNTLTITFVVSFSGKAYLN